MTDPDERTGRRRWSSRWSVIAFVVLALLVALAIIWWQLRGDPPKEPDMGLGADATAAVGHRIV